MDRIAYRLSRLSQGGRPYEAWKIREEYLNRILDKGSYSADQRALVKDHYIGPEPENVDVSNTVSGWMDRTAAMTKNSAMIGVNQIRQLWNEQEVIGERDAEDAKEAYDDISYYRGLQSSIPRDSGVGGVAQDVISSLPSLIENLAASVTAGYAGAKIGTAVGTMIAPGAGTAIGATVGFVSGILAGLGVNASMESASAFDDNLRNEEIKKRLEAKYGNNPALVDQAQRAIAMETAQAVMAGNIVDPTNIASAMLTTKGGQLFKGFLVSKVAPKANKFPNKFRVTKDALGGAATEAVQEGYQDALQQTETLYQIAKLDAEADPNTEKIPDRLDVVKDIDYGRVGYSALVGGIAGGGFTGSRSAIGKFADGKREKIRQEIRSAIDSGDIDQFNAVRNFYPIDSPERVIIEQEIKDVREGIHVDHRVDKDLTRYDMRNELANAMAEGQSGFEAFIKKNRDNPLFADVVNDYFDKLRSAEATAQHQQRLDEAREQILIGNETLQIADLNLRDTMIPPDPEGRWGGEPGVRVDTPYTPQDWATRTERKGAPKRLEDLTKPKSQRQVQEKKEAKPAPKEDFDVEKATRVQLINWLRQDDVDKGTYESQDVANAEYKRLMKSKKKGGESVQGLREMVKSRMPKQEAQPKPKAKPKEEIKTVEMGPTPGVEPNPEIPVAGITIDNVRYLFPAGYGIDYSRLPQEAQDSLARRDEELKERDKETARAERAKAEREAKESPERQAEINQIREEFLDDFANKDMGGQTILRNPDNSFKEIKLRRGDDERTYTAEDLDEMGYLSNNKENFLEGKVRKDLPQQPEPEVLADTDQQTETKEVSQEQVTEPEAVVEEEPTVVEPTKVEAEPPAETAPVEETREDTTPEGEASPELVLNFMSTLDPDENNYVIDEIRGRNNKFEGIQVDTYDSANQEWSTKEFTADEARALQIVNKKNKIVPSAIQDYVRRAAIFSTPKGPAGTPDQEIEMERTATFTETEGAEAEAQTAGTLRPTKEAESRLTPVEIRSSVQSAMEDELASPTAEDLRDIEGGRDAEVGFTENEIAYNKIDGTTFIADELKEAGIKNSQQKKPVAEMAEALQLKELSDLDGVTFVKGTDKNKNHYKYEKGQFAGGSVNGISQNLLDKLQTFAKNKGYTLNIIDEKTPLPTIEGVYKDPQKYPLLVAQAIKKTFGSASKFQNSISSNDPKGIRIYSIQPGETPVAGETVEDTGMNKADKLLEATRRISSDGIADGFVAPLYVERRAKAEVQEEGKTPTKAELEAIERGTEQEIDQEVKQEETVEYEKVEGEYVVNLFIDDDKDVAGVKGRAVSAIRIPFKGVTEKQLVDFIEALRSPETKKKVLLDKPLFSIAPDREVSNGPLDRTVLDKAVGEFTREFRGGVMLNFKTYDSPQQAQQETGIEFNPKARGALVGDQVYLFANNLKDVATARKVIFHESIGHYGVRNVLGDEDFNLFLDRVVTNNKSEVQAIAERYQKAGVFKDIGETELRIAAEELVAEAAEGRANRTVIQRIIEALQEFFAKHLGLLEPNEIKSIVLRAEKAFRTGEIYFGADRSVFGPAMDAQYSLGVFTREMADTIEVPALLKAHADRLRKEFGAGSKTENPFIYEIAGDKLREAQKDKNIEEIARLEEKLKEVSARSSLLASQYGGYWVGPDGRWRYHVNDFDQNGKELWTFNILKPDWYKSKNQNQYADKMFDQDKISELRGQGKIIEEASPDNPGVLLQHIRLADLLDHEQLRSENKKIWDKTYVTFEHTLSRQSFMQPGWNRLMGRDLKSSSVGTFTASFDPFKRRAGGSEPVVLSPGQVGVWDSMALHIKVNADRSPLVTMGTLVHELTHAIQDLHVLGGGANTSMQGKFYEYDGILYNRINASLKSLFSEMSDAEVDYLQRYVYELEKSLEGYSSRMAKASTPEKRARFLDELLGPGQRGIIKGVSEDPAPERYTVGETTASILNIYSAQVGQLVDVASETSDFIDPDLNKDLWFNEFFLKLEDGMMQAHGPNSDQHKRAKNLRRMARNLFAPHASGGSLEGIYMEPMYMRPNKLSAKWKRELQQRKNNAEFDHWITLTNYSRTLGETEARHHQQNFIDQYQAFDRGDLKSLEKMREVSPLSKGLSAGYPHHDRNVAEQENFKRFNEASPSFSMEDMLILLDDSGKRTQKVLQYADKSEEIRYSLSSERDPSESAPAWMNQAEKDVWLKFGDPHAGKSIKEKFEKLKENWWTKVRQGMFDKFAPLKYLSDKAYILARMSKSTDGPFSAMFQLGHIFMDEDGAIDVDTTKKSLVESMRPLGQDMDTFLRWVASNRAYELKKGPKGRDALKFLTDAEIAVGMNFNRGTTINAETGQRISRKKLFDDVLKDFQAVQNSVLDLAVKSGAVSKENAQLWKDQFYVPFYRVFDEDPAKRIGPNTIDGLVGQDAYKRLRGSDRGLADLLQNTLMNYHHLIDVSLKNKAATQSVSDLMQIDGAVKLGKYPINNEAMREYFENLEGADQQMTALVQPDNGQTIYIRENGERVYYRISDPFVLEALMSMNSVNKDNPIYKVLRGSKRWFTYAVTADPDFKIANLLRDTIGSIAVAPLSYNPLSNVARGWKGTKKDSKTYSKLVAGGGAFIFGNVSGTDPTSEGAKRLIEQGVKQEFIIDSPEKMGMLERMVKGSFSIARGAWGKYEDFGTRLENVNRAALYERLRSKEGGNKSHLEASFEARDLMDFSNTGSWGMIQYLSQWSPFLNARLQGMYKLGRGATSPAQRAQFATTVFAYTMASLGLYLAHWDDEEFKEREEWDRDTYHWFKIPGFETAIRIPKAFEVGTITTMVERMAEQMIDEEATGELFRERMLYAVTNTLSMDVRPQLLRPIIDIYSNKNPFTGRDIETMKMEGLNIEEKRNAFTSETATLLSRMNADTIGWDAVNLSPVQIEYAVQGFGAWVGTSVLAATDSIIRMADGKEPPDNGIGSIPVLGDSYRRFVVDLDRPRKNTKYATQFYDQLKEMNQTFSSIRELRQLGEMDRAMEKEKAERVLLRYRTSYNKLQRRISKLRTQAQRIANDPNMDSDLKVMRLDRIQAQINANIKVLQRRTNIQLREAS